MPVLINDPDLAREYRERRERLGLDKYDEVWDGVLVVPALPNTEHQRLVQLLSIPFSAVIDWDRGDAVMPGANVSDRGSDWKENYRCPDVVVVLAGGRARDCGTHWRGGPDLVVEIASPGEDPRQKNDFYAKVKTRELLAIDRDPWGLELYQLRRGRLVSAGRSDVSNPAVLASGVLPLTFQLRAGALRPAIVMTHTGTGQTWTA
jgi:Uma2 family endonuclease